MKESFPPPEQKGEITRDEVINGYRKFVDQGIVNPDDLDLNDPDVEKANVLCDQWQAQEDARAKGDEELQKQIDLAKTMLYIDAGFTDRDYLDEVLNDYLSQDAEEVEKKPDNPERVETRRQIASAIKKIRELLAKKG